MWSNYKIIDVGEFKRRRERTVSTFPPSFDPTGRSYKRTEANGFVWHDEGGVDSNDGHEVWRLDVGSGLDGDVISW